MQRDYAVSTTALSLSASGTTIASGSTQSSGFVVARTLVRSGLSANEFLTGSRTWKIHYVVSAMATPYEMYFVLQRRDSTGAVQSTSPQGTTRNSTGTYDDNINWDAGTWAANDQLALVWYHRRPSGTGNKSGTIDANGSSYVDETGMVLQNMAEGQSVGNAVLVQQYNLNIQNASQSQTVVIPNTPPTVTLNSPDNGGSSYNLTQDMLFTGIDLDLNEIEYQIQIDTVDTFDSQSSLVASCTSTGGSTLGLNKSDGTVGQCVNAPSTGTLSRLSFYIKRTGTISDSYVTAQLYAMTTGTYGTDGRGTNGQSPLATSATQIAFNDIPTSPTWIDFNFTGGYQMQSGTKYLVVFRLSLGYNDTNMLATVNNNSLGADPGNECNRIGDTGNWSYGSTLDVPYKIYYGGGPLLDKVSTADSGFSGTGNPHPWPSGNQITYTVPASVLSNGVLYYWRVRGKDPSGTNSWGAWSSTFSFTAQTGSTLAIQGLSQGQSIPNVVLTGGEVSITPQNVAQGQSVENISISEGNTSPQVTLNSPASGGSIGDQTPDLVFTGDDADLNDIRYEIQIDTTNTFDSQSPNFDTYNASLESGGPPNGDIGLILDDPDKAAGQAFTAHTNGILKSCWFRIGRGGAPGYYVARLYAHSGSYGSTSVGTGSPLAASQPVDCSAIGDDFGSQSYHHTFTFTDNYQLIKNTYYVMVLEHYSGNCDVSNYLVVWCDSTSPTHDGVMVSKNSIGNWGTEGGKDCPFSVDGTGAVIDAISNQDSGFVGSPDNSDPYTSGQAITYTPQTSLNSSTTYYWRVRGLDPSGTNTWGSWSSTRNFLVQIFTVQDASQGQSIQNVPISQESLLCQDINQGSSLQGVTLAQLHNVQIANLAQPQVLQGLTGPLQSLGLSVEDLSQPETIQSLVLIQQHILVSDNLDQPQSIESPILSLAFGLEVIDAAQVQSIGNIELTVRAGRVYGPALQVA